MLCTRLHVPAQTRSHAYKIGDLKLFEPTGSGRPPGDHAWDAETAEWAGGTGHPVTAHAENEGVS